MNNFQALATIRARLDAAHLHPLAYNAIYGLAWACMPPVVIPQSEADRLGRHIAVAMAPPHAKLWAVPVWGRDYSNIVRQLAVEAASTHRPGGRSPIRFWERHAVR